MPVLVVDDEPDIREDVAELLRDAGHEVLTASNGAEAMEQLKHEPKPCLILLDLMMPVMDGYEFRAAQAKDPALYSVPVVVITGAGGARQRASDLQVADYLEKPFRVRALLDTVARFCKRCAET